MMKDKSEFYMPVSLHFGENSIKQLPSICKNFGKNILFITSKDIESISNQVLPVLQTENFFIDIFYLESPEPSVNFIDKSATELSEKYDCLIALGGGSAIDMAKSLSIRMTNNQTIWSFANLSYRPPSPILNDTIPLIAIPTTAGTGSEVTPYAVLSNSKLNQKGTIQDRKIFPRVAVIDPTLMLTMPSFLTATTGIDAFAHAVESFINISKASLVSEMFSVESLKIIFNCLPQIIKNPENIKLRTKMAWASTLSGISIAHRGTTTAHAIAEVIGGLTKLPHSTCVAASTLPVLTETLKYEAKKLSDLYNVVFLNESNNSQNNAKKIC